MTAGWEVDRRFLLLLIVAIAASLEIGIAVGYGEPAVGAFPAAALVAGLLLAQPKVRTAFIIFGGLFALQSSSGVSVTKVAYGAGLVLCAAHSIRSIRQLEPEAQELVRSLWRSSALVLPVLAIGLVTGLANHNGMSAIARDAISYALLAYVPLFVIDCAATGPRFANGLLISAGVVATIIFTLDWLSRRGYAATPKLGLSSFVLVAILFAYAFARSQLDSRWILVAGTTIVSMLATGTRSSVLFLLAPLAMVLVPTVKPGRRLARATAAAVILLACVAGAVKAGFISTTSFDRLTGANGNLSLNYSVGAREGLQQTAIKLIDESPVFGNGLGTSFSFTNLYSGEFLRDLPTSDTILTTAARFGWLGLVAFVWIVAALATAPWRRGFRDPAALTAIGLLPVLAGYAVVASPLEDKGLALGLMLLVGASIAGSHESVDASAIRMNDESA